MLGVGEVMHDDLTEGCKRLSQPLRHVLKLFEEKDVLCYLTCHVDILSKLWK